MSAERARERERKRGNECREREREKERRYSIHQPCELMPRHRTSGAGARTGGSPIFIPTRASLTLVAVIPLCLALSVTHKHTHTHTHSCTLQHTDCGVHLVLQ